MFARHQIRILARIKRTFRGGQEVFQVTSDLVRGLQIGIVVPQRIRFRVNPQVFGLHLHDFLKVGMLPIAIGRILVYAAPRWIHKVELRSKRLPRHPLKLFVTPQGLGHAILDDVPIEPFLHRAPTLIVVIVSVDQHPAQFVA